MLLCFYTDLKESATNMIRNIDADLWVYFAGCFFPLFLFSLWIFGMYDACILPVRKFSLKLIAVVNRDFR